MADGSLLFQYSSLVSDASRSVMSKASSTSGGNTGSPASNSAEPTKDSNDDGDDDDDNNDDSSSDSDNVGPTPTGHVMAKLGGAVAAAAMLAL